MTRRITSIAGFLLLALGARPAAPQAVPDRPSISRNADRNDWEAYFDRGLEVVRLAPAEAEAAFYWASRLAPDRAEPLYAQWVAFWMRDQDRWLRYLRDDEELLRKPEVKRADSLTYRALQRNPFVHRGLNVLLYERLPGRWRGDPLTKGWLAYATGDLAAAAGHLREGIARDSVRNRWVRLMLAGTLVTLGQIDAALAQMEQLAAELRREEATTRPAFYQSKELVYYAIGMLHLARARNAPAELAFRQALAENLAFPPAYRMLARIAWSKGDHAGALASLAQAVELDGEDPVLRLEYGQRLLESRRATEAIVQLEEATRREPWWAEPYFELGRAREENGDREHARIAYASFVERAPRRTPRLGIAQAKVAALKP